MKRNKAPIIFFLAGLIIGGAVAGWWFGALRPRREADAKAHAAQAAMPTPQPPLYFQLRLDRYVKHPFRLLLNAYDGDVNKPESMTFQVTAIDVQQPSQFVKIGDVIAGTKFKVIRFDLKRAPGLIGSGDLSELTLQNTETGDIGVLVLERISDFPDSYALFRYLRNNTEFEVKKGAEFVLLPQATLRYKLIDVSEGWALIGTPGGQEFTVPRLNP
jgi:hypothetical protein